MSSPVPTTRLAPSPTGALHLGNARTFLVNWALARRGGWRIVLRIEDLDTPRVKPGAAEQAVDDLRWLGLDWDGGPSFQRHDLDRYRSALRRLAAMRLIYPCRCTRADIDRAAAAPHAEDESREPRYPGTCRPPPDADPLAIEQRALAAIDPDPDRVGRSPDRPALRLIVPDRTIHFHDRLAGPRSIDVRATVGDFVVATKAGMPAYQLAVVIDDALQGVTQVVRGDDLIPSAARQLLLYRLLDLAPVPAYCHLPLVVGPDGRRLAKRHGDTRLSYYRERGVPVQRVIGLIARWCGIADDRRPWNLGEFLARFDPDRLPRCPIVCTPEDHAWLLQLP